MDDTRYKETLELFRSLAAYTKLTGDDVLTDVQAKEICGLFDSMGAGLLVQLFSSIRASNSNNNPIGSMQDDILSIAEVLCAFLNYHAPEHLKGGITLSKVLEMVAYTAEKGMGGIFGSKIAKMLPTNPTQAKPGSGGSWN